MEVEEMSQRHLAVVTGASSGIGFELAKAFAENNYDLLVTAEDTNIITAANNLRETGVNVIHLRADLSTYDGVEKLYATIKSIGKPVECIAMNAGFGVAGEFAHTDLHREISLINLNIVSIVHLTKLILPDLVKQGFGKILYTSSLAATMPGPYFAVYAASKSFVQSFSEAIRNEVKDKGITVTALLPGPTDTKFFERADMLDTKANEGKKDDPADVAKDGVDALLKGDDQVVAGSIRNLVKATIAKFISKPTAAALQGREAKPKNAS